MYPRRDRGDEVFLLFFPFLESTDWNMNPWCANFNIGSLYSYTVFFFRPLIRLIPDHPRPRVFLHLYTLCARDLSIAGGGRGGEIRKEMERSAATCPLIFPLPFSAICPRTSKIIPHGSRKGVRGGVEGQVDGDISYIKSYTQFAIIVC